MKKVISLIASVAVMCSLATSAFAHTPTVTNATLEGTTVTVAEGQAFTFKVIGSAEIKKASIAKANLANLVANGWEISYEPSYVLDAGDVTPSTSFANYMLQNKWVDGNADVTGNVVLQFTATPGANAKIDGVTFTWQPTIIDTDLTQHKTAVTYTLAEAAPQEDKTTATIAANGEVTFDYADADVADAKLDGKKVVLSTTAVAGNEITDDTTVKVTYTPVEGAAETKTFGETLFEKLGAEGFGFLETESITFGIVCDATMTGTFTFALN